MNRYVETFRTHPSAVLLFGQLLAILLYPFFDDSAAGRALLGAGRHGAGAGRALGGPADPRADLDGGAARRSRDGLQPPRGGAARRDWVMLTSALLHAPFYFYISYGMIRYLFHDDQVTRDELYATGAAFTVVAWGFAYIYVAAQIVWPGSFVAYDGDGHALVVRAAVPLLHDAHQRRALRRDPGARARAVRW